MAEQRLDDVQGWNSEHPVFRRLIEEVRPKVIVEIGSWHGKSAIHMAKICRELGLGTRLYCVDTWLGAIEFYTHPTPERDLMLRDGYPQVFYRFRENVERHGVSDMITPVTLPSAVAHRMLPEADLIYVDGSHEYEDVKADIALYSRKLRPGGVMFGDDYGNSVFPGVKRAVDEDGKSSCVDGWFWVRRNR